MIPVSGGDTFVVHVDSKTSPQALGVPMHPSVDV